MNLDLLDPAPLVHIRSFFYKIMFFRNFCCCCQTAVLKNVISETTFLSTINKERWLLYKKTSFFWRKMGFPSGGE